MQKEPVNFRRKRAKKAFIEMLDDWINSGYYATYTFSTENGVICETVSIQKKEKLSFKNKTD